MTPITKKIDFRFWAVCFVLLFGTLLLFKPSLQNGFLDLDDPDYVTQNAHVRNGLTLSNFRWAFTTGYSANWHPLTWLSLMLDAQIYGDFPRGFHFTNNLLHALNGLLAFLLLRKMSRLHCGNSPPQSSVFWTCAIGAALFAWHPLRVESVAWVAERKDLLSGFFFFLTLLAYLGYARESSDGNLKPRILYSLALLLFVCGLMSKPMLVTLPFLLLLLDFWPLERWTVANWRMSTGPLIWEKIPFFTLAAASCIVTFLVQKRWGAVVESQSFDDRLSNAVISVVRYLGNFFWPHNLVVAYPLPANWPVVLTVGTKGMLLILTGITLWQLRQRPWLFVGWFWFLGMLVPVIGLVQVGLQAMADRYTYLPVLGLQLALLWSLNELRVSAQWKAAVAALVLLGCVTQTWKQIGYWRSPQALYQHALAVTTDNYMAECYLGTTLLNSNRFQEAAFHFRRAIRIRPDFNDALFKLGVSLAESGRTDEALAAYRQLLKINPRYALADYNMGILRLEQNRSAIAIRHFEATLRKNPNYDPAYVALGTAEARLGNPATACGWFERAIAIEPDNAVAHYNLANALTDLHRNNEALAEYEHALQLDPDLQDAYCNYGDALESLGRPAEACVQYRQALARNRKNPAAFFGLAVALEDLSKISPATACYRQAVALNPDNFQAQYNLGTILLNQNRPAQALAHFEAAGRVAPADEFAWIGAGLALERLGREDEAIEHYRHAIGLAPRNAQAYCCLGVALRRVGKISEAISNDETALRLNPDFPGLREQLALARRELAAGDKR